MTQPKPKPKVPKWSPFVAGDLIGAGEWRILRLIEEEEAVAEQSTLVERAHHPYRPLRIEQFG
jgi:hypothetical protein